MEEQGPEAGKGTGADAGARRRTERAMLELSGEIGFRAIDLEALLVRSGVGAEDFDSWFADLEDCFTAAYATQADALCDAMLGESREAPGWREGTEAALTVLLRFAAARPDVARALVREVHVVGGEALAKHEEVLQRLAFAITDQCDPPGSEAPLPWAPSFIVGAVEGVVSGHLDRGEEAELLAAAPELMDLIATFFDAREG
jgi:AcrR family transcriptional regulator